MTHIVKCTVVFIIVLLNLQALAQIHPSQIGFPPAQDSLFILATDTLQTSTTYGKGKWYNAHSILSGSADWYKLGTNSTPLNIQDDIFTEGEVHINDRLIVTDSFNNIKIGSSAGPDSIAELFAGSGILNSYSNLFFGLEAGAEYGDSIAFLNTENVLLGEKSGYIMKGGYQNVLIGFKNSSTANFGIQNTSIGSYSGVGIGNRKWNTTVGAGSGAILKGNSNTIVGSSSGRQLNGSNTIIGAHAAVVGNGSGNVMIGFRAGRFANGDGNIFIGSSVGHNVQDSDLLLIDNELASTYLIYGDFKKDSLVIGGDLKIKEALVDQNDSYGQPGQVLKSTGANIEWGEPELSNTGTSFPTSPSDGQEYYRTDQSQWYYYDAGRNRWLGKEILQFGAGRGAAIGSPQYLRGFNGMLFSANRGLSCMYEDVVFVGYSYACENSSAGNVEVRKNGSMIFEFDKGTTTADKNNTISVADNTASGEKYQIYVDGGTFDYPQVTIFYRRDGGAGQ